MWFQQNGAASHTTLANRVLLEKKLMGRVISRICGSMEFRGFHGSAELKATGSQVADSERPTVM